jgi:NAD(P)H-hydrate epimerase
MEPLSINQVFEKIPRIGSNSKDWKLANTSLYLIEDADIRPLIPLRDKSAHKGDFGHALLIAGSKGKMGAAVLAAKACLKSGAGLLTVRIPSAGETIMQVSFPEAMVETDPGKNYLTRIGNLTKYKAIGIGPGIGTERKTANILYRLFENTDKTLVIDADALNLIGQDKNLLKALPPGNILTPHPGEFDRLAGTSANACIRLQKAILLAEKIQCYIVLKGSYTAICTPNGHCYFNSTGNPGMATAGSGDVLTGIILGLTTQSYTIFHAILAGVFLHGLAGDIAASENSEESLTASDIIANLGSAFKKITYFCAQSG